MIESTEPQLSGYYSIRYFDSGASGNNGTLDFSTMASPLHHHFFLIRNHRCRRTAACLSSSKLILPPSKSIKIRSLIPRFRTAVKSLTEDNSTALPKESQSSEAHEEAKPRDPESPLAALALRLGDKLRLDSLGLEILSIAFPAALALAADPLCSLVDTAFVGHLGSVELAAVGVSVSVFNLTSKLFNVPLLNITTSFVAEEQALITKDSNASLTRSQDFQANVSGKVVLPSVSTSLALAAGLGMAEAIALSFGSGFLMNTMGIPADSPMRVPAEQFLALRAFGAPPVVIALAAQGTFRGFKDTKTPFYATGAGNLLNAILDPILIFFFGLGVSGAAVATVISEYLTASVLLFKLNSKVLLVTPEVDGGRVTSYLKSGALLVGRTMAVLATTTFATSLAAREGPVTMAGYQICFQVWLAVSLLTDALALAGQALLASDFSQGNYDQAQKVVSKIVEIGLITGVGLGVILLLGFGPLSKLFSNDSEVLEICKSGTLFVAGSQPINALAFVLDGLYYGVSDYGYAAYSMLVIGLISVVFMLVATPLWGLPGVWAGLFLFMTLRVIAGTLRLATKSGPWKLFNSIEAEESD